MKSNPRLMGQFWVIAVLTSALGVASIARADDPGTGPGGTTNPTVSYCQGLLNQGAANVPAMDALQQQILDLEQYISRKQGAGCARAVKNLYDTCTNWISAGIDGAINCLDPDYMKAPPVIADTCEDKAKVDDANKKLADLQKQYDDLTKQQNDLAHAYDAYCHDKIGCRKANGTLQYCRWFAGDLSRIND